MIYNEIITMLIKKPATKTSNALAGKRKTYRMLKPSYDKNVKHLNGKTTVFPERLAILLDISTTTVYRYIDKNCFPNAYLGLTKVLSKPLYNIPISDVHDFMKRLEDELTANE